MKQPQYAVGIDVSSRYFTVSVSRKPGISLFGAKDFNNTPEGFDHLIEWFKACKLKRTELLICMEATGVYGELLSHYLYTHKYLVAVEHPLKVKRAFKPLGHKTDAVDSLQIAEYAIRFHDSLNGWEPRKVIVEQLKTLLVTRELLVKHRTAVKNQRVVIQRKQVISRVAVTVLEEEIKQLSVKITSLEKAMSELISSQPEMRQIVDILKTGPGIRELLATHLLVLTNGFSQEKSYRQLSSYLHLAPLKYESGSSILKKPKTPKYGPAIPRKLLHLAARSVTTHNPKYRKYLLEKRLQGKDKYLIYNNVANKILKVACAMIRDRKPYSDNYASINPKYLNFDLQRS